MLLWKCLNIAVYYCVWTRKPIQFSDNLSNVQGHYQEVQTVIETDPMPLNVGFCASRLLNDVLWNPVYIYLCSNSNFVHISLFSSLTLDVYTHIAIDSTCVMPYEQRMYLHKYI